MLSTVGKICSRRNYEICFSYFSQDTRFDISKIFSSLEKETICMKCLILFAKKNKKIVINLSSVDFAQCGKC